MPQRRNRFGTSLFGLVFLAAALSLLSAVVRRQRTEVPGESRARRPKIRLAPRRIAASLAFATIFFAGAALTAGAGDNVAQLLESNGSALSAEATDTTTTTEDPATVDPAADSAASNGADPASDPADEPSAEPQPPTDVQPTAEQPTAHADDAADTADEKAPHHSVPVAPVSNDGGSAVQGTKLHSKPSKGFLRAAPVLRPQTTVLRSNLDTEPEVDEPNTAATIWLHRALPDPTPASRRLTPAFAHRLARVSSRNRVDWALVLGVLRASGKRGSVPATPARLHSLAKRLGSLERQRNAWTSVLALEGRTSFADRSIALRHLYRAVGLKALVRGFEWAKPSLSKRLLNDPRISIYPGGRTDIQAGRVNIRVLVLIAYLAEAHGQVTVSCLISGHGLYARPGVVSAHIYGLAADISALGGTSIFGNQQPGSVTENAVRNILLLPVEMQARQVISLLGLGGPSFPLSNHDDHIHVGF
jgi:hypothetical protein